MGYTGYALSFKNVNNQKWNVNLFMNTGWTDAPWSEPNNFYQNGWVSLDPGESATLFIDFTGLANLGHISNIGFQLAFNDPAQLPGGSFNGDKYHMEVSPVPEPATMLLLGSGLLGMAGLARRRFKK